MKSFLAISFLSIAITSTAAHSKTLVDFSGSLTVRPTLTSVTTEDGVSITDPSEISSLISFYTPSNLESDYFFGFVDANGDPVEPIGDEGSLQRWEASADTFSLFDDSVSGWSQGFQVGGSYVDIFNNSDVDLTANVEFNGNFSLNYFSILSNVSASASASPNFQGFSSTNVGDSFSIDGVGSYSSSGSFSVSESFNLRSGGGASVFYTPELAYFITVEPVPTTVAPVPLPATAWMLFSALAALLVWRRRSVG